MSKQPHKITIDPKTGHLRITYKGDDEPDRLYADVTEGLSVTTGDISTEGSLNSRENITAQKDSSDEATIGEHPNFSNFASFYREGDDYYTVGADSTNAFINAQTGGKVFVRESNSNIARFSASGIAVDKQITSDLHISGNVSAAGYLRTSGNIDTSGNISATGYIQANGRGHFDGLSSQGSIYSDSNISASGHIQARRDLFASGTARARSGFSSSGSINIEGSISARGNIRARGNISASGYIQCHSDLHVRRTMSARRVRATQSASISQLFARSAHIATKMSSGNVHTNQVRNVGGGQLRLSASHAYIHFNHGSAGVHTGNDRRLHVSNTWIEHEQHRNTNSSTNCRMDNAGEIFRQNSSIKHKTDIEDIDTEIDTSQIYNLRPVVFSSTIAHEEGERTFGLIAEEVDGYLPPLVDYDDEDLPQGVRYPMLSVLLLEELKRLEDRVSELEANQ